MRSLACFSEKETPFSADLISVPKCEFAAALCKCLWKMSFRVKMPSPSQDGNVDATQFGNKSSRAQSGEAISREGG